MFNEGEKKKTSQNIIFDDNNRVKYRKGNKLGGGGFGEVYEFIDQKTNKVYAGKIIPIKTIESNPQSTNAFHNENKFNNILDYEFICKCFSTFKDSQNAYFLLEYQPNRTLNELLNTRHTLTEFEVKHYGYQILLAMEYLHSKNIIHRDLKLSNILLTAKMEVRLCDFGLAIENGGDGQQSVCGTPNYIAPEVLMKKKGSYGFEVDIWSFGVILYTLLYHKTPFEEEGKGRTKTNIINIIYVFPDNIHVSQEAINLIRRILVKDPHSRPTIEEIKNSDFFNGGINIPKTLPTSTLTTPLSDDEIKSVILNARAENETMDQYNLYSKQSFGNSDKKHGTKNKKHKFDLSNDDDEDEDVSDDSEKSDTISMSKALSPARKEKKNSGVIDPPLITVSPVQIHTKEEKKVKIEEYSSNLRRLATPRLGCFSSKKAHDESAHNLNINEFDSGNNSAGHYNNFGNNNSACENEEEESGSENNVVHNTMFSVEKFMDYSDKYGIGYLLSTGNTGVYFNDGTKIVMIKSTNFFYYIDKKENVSQFCLRNYPKELNSKVKLLELFHKTLIRNVKDRETYQVNPLISLKPLNGYVKKWEKTKYASFFLLSNNIIQVVFNDKTEVHFNLEEKYVNYIDKTKKKIKEKLNLGKKYQNEEMNKRIAYAQSILISNRTF